MTQERPQDRPGARRAACWRPMDFGIISQDRDYGGRMSMATTSARPQPQQKAVTRTVFPTGFSPARWWPPWWGPGSGLAAPNPCSAIGRRRRLAEMRRSPRRKKGLRERSGTKMEKSRNHEFSRRTSAQDTGAFHSGTKVRWSKDPASQGRPEKIRTRPPMV
jgi:hypothetical protein